MKDPVNPNIYGLLENVKRSYNATIDLHGDGSDIFVVNYYQNIYCLHR